MNTLETISSLPQPTDQLDYFLIDGSGSMQDKWWDFLAAIDTFSSSLKLNNIQSHVVAHVFDTVNMEMIQRDVSLADCPSFVSTPLGANFTGTPLYDAINLMGRRLKERDPSKCSILIVTDGYDTDSKTSVVQAKSILDWCRAKGWQVTFIGCDFNNSAQARALGASEATCIGVQKKLLSDAAKNLATKRAAYGHSGDDIEFSDTEKQQFGGYLSDQSNSNGRP